MNILIAYGTYSGSTKSVGEQIQTKLNALGHTTHLLDIREVKKNDFDQHDAFILGTNTWYENKEEGNMNGAFLTFRESMPDKSLFRKRPAAVYALGDETQYLQFCKSADHLEALVREYDGTLVTPALRISQYFSDPQYKQKEIDEWLIKVLKGFTAQ